MYITEVVKININKLKEYVDNSGMTVHEIQVKANLKSGQLYRILKGINKDINLSTAFKIADALNIDINELRGE